MHLLFIFGYIFVEIYSLMLLADAIGGFPTLLWVFVAAGIGVWLIRENGRENLQRMMMGIQQGISPQESLLDNLFIMLAGLLFISPGVFSDLIAVLLLIPQIRHLFFGRTMRFVQSKGQKIYSNNTTFFTFFGGPNGPGNSNGPDGFNNLNGYHDFTRHQHAHREDDYGQQTMDAEYVVREQAPRKTTAVIIESESVHIASPKSSSENASSENAPSENASFRDSSPGSSSGPSSAHETSSAKGSSKTSGGKPSDSRRGPSR